MTPRRSHSVAETGASAAPASRVQASRAPVSRVPVSRVPVSRAPVSRFLGALAALAALALPARGAAQPYRLEISVDDRYDEVFVDGVRYTGPNQNTWNVTDVWTLAIAPGERVIELRNVRNTGGPGGFMGVLTDTRTGAVVATTQTSNVTFRVSDSNRSSVACGARPLTGGSDCVPRTESGSNYAYCRDSRPWTNARDRCRSGGMQLAKIDNVTENSNLRSNASALGLDRFYIGANDRGNEGRWRWGGWGEPVSYRNWSGGEPNDYGSGEDCAEVYGSGFWNDIFCDASFQYVCEWERGGWSWGLDRGAQWLWWGSNCQDTNRVQSIRWTVTIPGCSSAAQCDDGNPCTDDACVASRCQNTARADGVTCGSTGNECSSRVCAAGSCVTRNQPNGTECTDDGNDCTSNTCQSGTCSAQTLPNGSSCPDDGNSCTTDTCQSGSCQHQRLSAGTFCPGGICTTTGVCEGCVDTSAAGTDLGCSADRPFCVGGAGARSCAECIDRPGACGDGRRCISGTCAPTAPRLYSVEAVGFCNRYLYEPDGEYVQVYDSTTECAPGWRPVWGALRFDVDTPDETAVEFQIRTAPTREGLAGSTPASIVVPPETSPARIDDALRAARLTSNDPFLSVSAVLRSNAARTRTPTLFWFEVDYECRPLE